MEGKMLPLGKKEFSYTMPKNICAYCGEDSETSLREVKLTHTNNYLVVKTQQKLKIEIPICDECKQNFDKQSRSSCVFMLLPVVMYFILKAFDVTQSTAIISSVVTLFLIILLIGSNDPDEHVVKFNGKELEFMNERFNELFLKINYFSLKDLMKK